MEAITQGIPVVFIIGEESLIRVDEIRAVEIREEWEDDFRLACAYKNLDWAQRSTISRHESEAEAEAAMKRFFRFLRGDLSLCDWENDVE